MLFGYVHSARDASSETWRVIAQKGFLSHVGVRVEFLKCEEPKAQNIYLDRPPQVQIRIFGFRTRPQMFCQNYDIRLM